MAVSVCDPRRVATKRLGRYRIFDVVQHTVSANDSNFEVFCLDVVDWVTVVAVTGDDQVVLVEGPSRKDPRQMSGRTENNRVVNFDGGPELIGQFVTVRITEALPNSLRAAIPASAMTRVA